MRPWHRHRDPTWQVAGCHRYEQCRCGARRVTRAYRGVAGPVAPDWPDMIDSHGQLLDCSDWQQGVWQTTDYPPRRH